MKIIHTFSLLLLACSLSPAAASTTEPPLTDNFTKSEQEARRPTRGEWTVKDGTIACTQDDELYKKYQDHGPVLWYGVEVTFKGNHSMVKIGDYLQEGSHPAIAQHKIIVGLGFSFGTMEFKDFSIQ